MVQVTRLPLQACMLSLGESKVQRDTANNDSVSAYLGIAVSQQVSSRAYTKSLFVMSLEVKTEDMKETQGKAGGMLC